MDGRGGGAEREREDDLGQLMGAALEKVCTDFYLDFGIEFRLHHFKQEGRKKGGGEKGAITPAAGPCQPPWPLPPLSPLGPVCRKKGSERFGAIARKGASEQQQRAIPRLGVGTRAVCLYTSGRGEQVDRRWKTVDKCLCTLPTTSGWVTIDVT